MKMIYENNFGTVAMFGEGNDGFCICETDGTELFGKERSLIHFNNKDGYNESSSFFGQRVITVSGDIKTKNFDIIKNAVRVFSLPGNLTIKTENENREIYVNDTVFRTVQKNSMYKTFCVQMTCDNPHFTDCSDTFKGVYSRKNLITSDTYLPAVFSSRSAGGIAENNGDVICEPKITVKCLADAPEDGIITIINKTTDSKIIINYKVSQDEIITVDIPQRIILSSINGDITSHLDSESYLCDMNLICGENEIDVLASDGNRNCEIYIVYRNLYTGVVI